MEKDSVWMTYEEAEFERQWYARREQELLRSWGLGWIADFCSKPIDKNNELHDLHTEHEQLPDS